MLGNDMIMSFMTSMQAECCEHIVNQNQKINLLNLFHPNKNIRMLQYLQYRENIKILGCKIATKLCGFLNIVAEFDAKTTT